MPKISACIVAYCDYDEVCAAVRSILHYTPAPDLALYVVDNGSPDGCGRQLAETDFGDSRVTVLPLEKNIGFGKGHNYVLDRLTSDVHFILNPDILLTGDVLEDMAAWLLARPGAAMATPQLRYPDGKLQHLPRRKPTPWLLLARQLAPKLGGCFKKADDHYTMQDEDLTVPRRIEFCTGSFMAVRTDVFKEIGGFDPGYFMYVEDADLTQKVLQKEPSGWLRSFPPFMRGTAPPCATQASSRCSLSAWDGISKNGAAGKARFDTSIAKQMKIVQPPVFAGGCSFFARLL